MVTAAVDSGATDNVTDTKTLSQSVPITEGPAFARGVQYEVANGIRIPNLGERKIVGHVDDGVIRSLTMQVCDVNKSLLSVSKMVKGGNRVVFDDSGSYIEDKVTKEKSG